MLNRQIFYFFCMDFNYLLFSPPTTIPYLVLLQIQAQFLKKNFLIIKNTHLWNTITFWLSLNFYTFTLLKIYILVDQGVPCFSVTMAL